MAVGRLSAARSFFLPEILALDPIRSGMDSGDPVFRFTHYLENICACKPIPSLRAGRASGSGWKWRSAWQHSDVQQR